MPIKLTAKEMAALALALQERPEKPWDDLAQAMEKLSEKTQNHEKIVPPPAGERKRLNLHDGQLIKLRGEGIEAVYTTPIMFNGECLILKVCGDMMLMQTPSGPVVAHIDNIEAVEDAKA